MHVASHHSLTNSQLSTPSAAGSAGGVMGRVARAFHNWRERSAELRELALMDERALRDARLTRWEVQHELARPFWRG
jgi:uncharacterized protein YjiS (DUF1127 family)